jgi:hypothetical protein
MSERVTISVEGGIADVRLARPDKLNALDRAQIFAIADALARLEVMADLRCVVLSGEGRAFCAGLDFQSVAGDPELLDLIPRTHGAANLFQHIALGWRALPVPVIAAVHGVAFGGGAQIVEGRGAAGCRRTLSRGGQLPQKQRAQDRWRDAEYHHRHGQAELMERSGARWGLPAPHKAVNSQKPRATVGRFTASRAPPTPYSAALMNMQFKHRRSAVSSLQFPAHLVYSSGQRKAPFSGL